MKIRNVIAVLAISCALAQALAQTVSAAQAEAPAKIYSKHPTGEGDPAAVTCRPPMVLEGQRLLGPEVCKSNAEWAQYAKDGMEVSADGRHDVPVKSTSSCRSMGGGGGGATGGMAMSTTMRCD